MLRKVLLALALMTMAALIAAPVYARDPGGGYLLLAQSGHGCGSLSPEHARRALADEFSKLFGEKWISIGPKNFAIQTVRGLRTQILHSNYRYVHYPRNVAIWKDRVTCIDACFSQYRIEKKPSAGPAESALDQCIRSCIVEHTYAKCP